MPLAVTTVRSDFRGTIDQRDAGTAVVTRVVSSPCDVSRTRRHVDSSDDAGLLFSLQIRGTNVVSQNGRDALVAPGECVAYMTGQPYELKFPADNAAIIMHVPLDLLGLSKRDAGAVVARSIGPRAPMQGVATSHLKHIFRELRDTSPEARTELGLSASDMLRVLLRQLSDSDATAHEPGLRAMIRTVRLRAADPEFNPSDIAREHHVSLRTVQNTFAAVGDSPAACIRRTRLERAAELLRLPNCSLSIVQISHAAGFEEPATFRRAFHNRFGQSPAEFKRSAHRAGHADRGY